MAAQVHQLGVDVGGHAAVGGGGEVGAAGHHAGAPGWGALSTPLHQGTISVPGTQQGVELVTALILAATSCSLMTTGTAEKLNFTIKTGHENLWNMARRC